MIREMSVSGSFYPDTKEEVERYFEYFSKIYDDKVTLPDIKSRSIIVPHAGYIYSGFTANIAYRVLKNSHVKKLVVIGPSHRVAFRGVSLCMADSYETPLGDIKSSKTLVDELREEFALKSILNPHAEHSTEVQFPFIKHYLSDADIVELVYGDVEAQFVSKIIDFILKKEDCGVIISTDLSHFYTLKDANKLDNICLKSIEKKDISLLHEGCEACGKIGVEAILLSADRLHLKATLLDYRTSADTTKDTNSVVGYLSACFSADN